MSMKDVGRLTARFLAVSSCAAALLAVGGCGGNGNSSSGSTGGGGGGTTTEPTGLISVSGKTILRDGKTWIPHGFLQVGFVVPPGYTAAAGANPIFVTAAQDYTPSEYTDMVQAGADSVRIQVAQTGIDPNGLYASATFTKNVVAAITAARAAGLTVIISDQDESQTGETDEPGLPGAAAQRAWANLLQTAPSIGQDTGIMFEIYNEPFVGTTPEGPPPASEWSQWQTAMNALTASIRATGAKNVIIADGLEHAEELSGAPALTDSLNEVVYGSHPHPHNYEDQNALGTDASGNVVSGTGWNVKFGTFAASNPVIVTEWGNGYYCDELTGASSVAFLQYLQTLGVGLTASTWDWAGPNFGSVRVNFPNSTITSFPTNGSSICDSSGNIKDGIGPGKLVQTWYSTGTPSATLE